MSEYNYDNAPTNPHHGGKMTPTDMSRRIEELKEDLAKAAEALRFYAWENELRLPSEGPWGTASEDFGRVARTTLAELEENK